MSQSCFDINPEVLVLKLTPVPFKFNMTDHVGTAIWKYILDLKRTLYFLAFIQDGRLLFPCFSHSSHFALDK